MKLFIFTFLLLFSISNNSFAAKDTSMNAYDFSFKTLADQSPMPLSSYKGKVLLVVNTASKCGFTGQYKELEALYKQFKNDGLIVIGVPSDNFGGQEFGTDTEIAKFCESNYGVTFPMTSKENVTGDSAHPFYKWARENLGLGSSPKWNFHKYLIGRDGKAVDFYMSTTSPQSDTIIKAVEKALNAEVK